MINNINDLLDEIEKTGYLLNDLYFRGQKNGRNASWFLYPSFYRKSNEYLSTNGVEFERELIYKYYEKNLSEFSDILPNDLLSIISVLQHHGFPTRLLDVTKNPLSALFFAVSEAKKEDNPVFYILHPKKEVYSHFTSNKIITSFYDDNIKKEDCIFVNGKIVSERIQRQQGDFILMFNKIDLFEHDSFDVIECEISVSSIEKIKKQLDILGYGKHNIYPSIENNVEHFLKMLSDSVNAPLSNTGLSVSKEIQKKTLEKKGLSSSAGTIPKNKKLLSQIKTICSEQ